MFFLDYFATGTLEVEAAATIIEGIADGCRLSGCALIGGETAEMPGMYARGRFRSRRLRRGRDGTRHGPAYGRDGGRCPAGARLERGPFQRLLAGCAGSSSAPGWRGRTRPPSGSKALGAELLTPTRLYVTPCLAAIRAGGVHALAHITGGGLTENLPRVLPDGLGAEIDLDTWDLPPVFDWLAQDRRHAAGRDAQDVQLRHRHGAVR